jgi:hypothetical protein
VSRDRRPGSCEREPPVNGEEEEEELAPSGVKNEPKAAGGR